MERITKRGLWIIIAVLCAAQSLDLLASGLDYFLTDGQASIIPLLLSPVILGLSLFWAVAAWKRKEPILS